MATSKSKKTDQIKVAHTTEAGEEEEFTGDPFPEQLVGQEGVKGPDEDEWPEYLEDRIEEDEFDPAEVDPDEQVNAQMEALFGKRPESWPDEIPMNVLPQVEGMPGVKGPNPDEWPDA